MTKELYLDNGRVLTVVSILGCDYSIETKQTKDDSKLSECDGYCDYTTHEIVVAELDDNHPMNMSNLPVLLKKIKRHEVIHAFLFESGLKEYAENETVVDWIASQFPKMLDVFKDIDAL